MKLVVLSEDRLSETRHFSLTGSLADGRPPSDAWIGESVGLCVQEIDALRDRVDVHWDALQSSQRVSSAARTAHKAWKSGEDLEPSMKELGRALRGA